MTDAGGDARAPVDAGEDTRAASWAISIGDVSGHGPAAAVVMAMYQSMLHACADRASGPADLLAQVNRHLCGKPVGDSFVTAFLGFYAPATRLLTWARAGHPPPLIWQPSSREVRELDQVGDVPMGIEPGAVFAESRTQLEPGQTLVLYTDGISEARNARGRWFGIDGMAKALAEAEDDPESVVRTINRAVERHRAGVRPNDDQALVAMRVSDLKSKI